MIKQEMLEILEFVINTWKSVRAASGQYVRLSLLQFFIISLFLSLFVGPSTVAASLDVHSDDASQSCLMAVISPEENEWYDGKAPVFEVQVTSSCNCTRSEIGIQIQVSRESNKRNLNATTFVSCSSLIGEGAAVDLLDLKDGLWEGYVSIADFHLSNHVRFHYVSPFRPQIQILLPVEGYVFGPNVNPVIITHISDVSEPEQPLLGIYLHIEINNQFFGLFRNPGRDKYIPLKDASGKFLPDGEYDIELQVLDLFERPRGDPAYVRVVMRRQGPADFEANSDEQRASSIRGAGWLDFSGPCSDEGNNTEGNGQCKSCSSHGRCEESVCICEGDWIGSRCEHHILYHTHFLPLADMQRGCGSERMVDGLTLELAEAVERLQNPPDCRGEGVTFITDNNRHPLALGHGLRWEALMLGDSLHNGSGYLPGATWMLFDYGRCRGKGLWCHIEHPSSCAAVVADLDSDRAQQTPVEVTHVHRVWPVPASSLGLGLFHWSSSLLGLILRPRPALLRRIAAVKRAIGWRGGMIGMHIRYGDGCIPNQMHRPRCEPLEVYKAEAEHMARRYSLSTLYLATDSADAVARLAAADWNPPLRLLHLPMNRSVFDSEWWIDHRAAYGVVDREMVSESALLDLLLLSQCDYLIGSFSSHFSAAALELSAFTKGYVPPYVS